MRWLLPLLLLPACKGDDLLPREKLLDPETCADCHPEHFEQWRGSMHAYAADDPVFLAMNAMGQRETGGALGDFCIRCHAPMAVAEGETDGTDIEQIPQHLKGVTCAFCHMADEVDGTHNNPIGLSRGQILRGGIRNPVDPGVHVAEYSKLHDREQADSAALCGSCHDIITPAGGHIERTFLEWKTSLYAEESAGFGLTCGDCHMRGRDDVAADFDEVPVRRVHDHRFPAVDTAVIDFPDKEGQLLEIQRLLDSTVRSALCVGEDGGDTVVQLTLENVAAGHSFPSGAAADRRLWVELSAEVAGAEVWSSGRVSDGAPVQAAEDADPEMWTFHDTLLDADGAPTHKFWEAVDFESRLLPAPLPGDTATANHRVREWWIPGQVADRVSVQLHLRPMALDALQELVDAGDLDPSIPAALPQFTLNGATLTWTPATGIADGDLSCVP